MIHTIPDTSTAQATANDPTVLKQLLQAYEILAAAFQGLQRGAGSDARYEAQAHIYLAREEIEQAIAWQQQTEGA